MITITHVTFQSLEIPTEKDDEKQILPKWVQVFYESFQSASFEIKGFVTMPLNEYEKLSHKRLYSKVLKIIIEKSQNKKT